MMSDLTEEIKDIRKKWVEDSKLNGHYELAKKLYSKPTGINADKRWLSSNKEFKPLRDLLGQSIDPITKRFYSTYLENQNVEQFVMSPEIAYEVQVLVKGLMGKLEDIKRLMPTVMPPYQKICVEMPLTIPIREMRSPLLDDAQSQVQRIGAYIETTLLEDGSVTFSFSPYYEFVSGFVNFSNIILTHHKDEHLEGFLGFVMRDFGMVWNAMFHPAMTSYAADNNVSPKEFYEKVGDLDLLKAMGGEAVEEVPSLFFAWLVLLNSKSGVTKTKVQARMPHPKLGKRERARRGRSAYTVVSLSDTESVDAEGLVTQQHIVSAHRVRGHFKARKSGLYWWRPHVRGIGELKEREGYVVTA